MAETPQTINVPQLILVLLFSGLAIRYFFFSPSSLSAAQPSNRGNATADPRLRAREADVERVQQMFPQVSRRHIMWDLQRNGGNVVATTERILSGRGLENPPISFQPPPPATSPNTGSSSSTSAPAPRATQPDLIKRYNLSSKLAESASESSESTNLPGPAAAASKQAWSANKEERQALLQKRREEMILAARRKMEAKVAAEAFQGQAGPGK